MRSDVIEILWILSGNGELGTCEFQSSLAARLLQRYTTEFENFEYQTVAYAPQYVVVLPFISRQTQSFQSNHTYKLHFVQDPNKVLRQLNTSLCFRCALTLTFNCCQITIRGLSDGQGYGQGLGLVLGFRVSVSVVVRVSVSQQTYFMSTKSPI